jgi:exonuclease III
VFLVAIRSHKGFFARQDAMKIITWNVNGAPKHSPAWDFLLSLEPDLVLLQEVGCIPSRVINNFDHLTRPAVNEIGEQQSFHTGVLVKGRIVDEPPLETDLEWVNREIAFLQGTLVSCTVRLTDHSELHVVSVHSPYWPLDRRRLAGIDAGPLKTTNPDLYATELLWYALKKMVTTGSWVVGGDFNRSETFDPEWRRKNGKKWLRIPGSAQMLRRMRELGFTECLRKSEQDPIVPTFRHNRTKMIDHQIDHLFVSNNLMPTLQECKIGDQKIIFDEKRFLSDHLPIIAEFSESQLASQIRHSEQSCLA